MYLKDKNVRITIRLDKSSSDFVTSSSEQLGITPSAFVRQLIFQQMYAQRQVQQVLDKTIKEQLERTGKASNENKQTNIDNLV
jgi:hypothetical protein